jgi:transketolase
MENISQRNAFWGRIYELAKENKDIVLVTADMGAQALDKFRIDLSAQYIDVGIAEQQAVSLASGLALSGKKPFVYAIAPFVTLRCYEHTRVNLASMNLPVTLVGVGAGVSYDDSGPTHHAVDDISALRIFPNLRIHNISDSVMARAFADISCKLTCPNYVRMDRKILPVIYDSDTDFSVGLTVLVPGSDVYIVATGNMVHRALEISEDLKNNGINAGVIDVYTFPINEEVFVDKVKNVEQIVTLEEHTLPGGLGSAVCEVLSDHRLLKPVKRIGMNFKKGYCYKYGGRDNIQSLYGLDKKSIVKNVMSCCKLKVPYVCEKVC